MENIHLKNLDNDQLEAFDKTGYVVYEGYWEILKECISKDFKDGKFNFLDIGGGNGRLTDMILAEYPDSKGVIIDNADYLIAKNRPNPRKEVINCSAEHIDDLFKGENIDIILLNVFLHHLVADSYFNSKKAILDVVTKCGLLLSDRGRVSIWENVYSGKIEDSLSSRLIFELTSLKSVKKIVRKYGANTAGTGVCFLSYKQWLSLLYDAGLEIKSQLFIKWEGECLDKNISPIKRHLLFIKDAGNAHYWCVRKCDE